MKRTKRRQTAVLALSMLALTLIAPCALGQDPDPITELRRQAEQGDADEQLFLGLMYVEGRGVLKDPVLAHMWLNISGANGNEIARESRDNLERDMTHAEISRATELARVCMASYYQDCGR